MHGLQEKEQQRVAVVPGNVRFICISQVSSDAATLQRGRCRYGCTAAAMFLPVLGSSSSGATAAAAATATGAAVYRQFDDLKLNCY